MHQFGHFDLETAVGGNSKGQTGKNFSVSLYSKLVPSYNLTPFLWKEGSPYYSPQELLLTPVDELGQESKEWSDFHYIHTNISKARNSILPGPVFSS